MPVKRDHRGLKADRLRQIRSIFCPENLSCKENLQENVQKLEGHKHLAIQAKYVFPLKSRSFPYFNNSIILGIITYIKASQSRNSQVSSQLLKETSHYQPLSSIESKDVKSIQDI